VWTIVQRLFLLRDDRAAEDDHQAFRGREEARQIQAVRDRLDRVQQTLAAIERRRRARET
jgi:hypothetical protein